MFQRGHDQKGSSARLARRAPRSNTILFLPPFDNPATRRRRRLVERGGGQEAVRLGWEEPPWRSTPQSGSGHEAFHRDGNVQREEPCDGGRPTGAGRCLSNRGAVARLARRSARGCWRRGADGQRVWQLPRPSANECSAITPTMRSTLAACPGGRESEEHSSNVRYTNRKGDKRTTEQKPRCHVCQGSWCWSRLQALHPSDGEAFALILQVELAEGHKYYPRECPTARPCGVREGAS